MMTPCQMPKMRPLPVTSRGERRRWEITEDWEYEGLDYTQIYIVKKGFIFDGASIPRLFWNILSPVGYLFIAGLIHDHLYKYAGIWTRAIRADGSSGTIYLMTCDKKESDKIFQDVADQICTGSKRMTWLAKKTLDIFGGTAWNYHRTNDEYHGSSYQSN